MRRTMVTLVVVAAVMGCERGGQERRPPKGQARRAAAVAAVQVAPAAYRLGEVDRLRVELPWAGPAGLRAPRVDVRTPQGRLYAQLPVEVEADGSGAGTAAAVLEVRGTPIDGYHMVGSWRFALVDGGGSPIATQTILLQ